MIAQIEREIGRLLGQHDGAVELPGVDRREHPLRERDLLDPEVPACHRLDPDLLEQRFGFVVAPRPRLHDGEPDPRLQVLAVLRGLAVGPGHAPVQRDGLDEIGLRGRVPQTRAAGGERMQRIDLASRVALSLEGASRRFEDRNRLLLAPEPAERESLGLQGMGQPCRVSGPARDFIDDREGAVESSRLHQGERLEPLRVAPRLFVSGEAHRRAGRPRGRRVHPGAHQQPGLAHPELVASRSLAAEPSEGVRGARRRAHRIPGALSSLGSPERGLFRASGLVRLLPEGGQQGIVRVIACVQGNELRGAAMERTPPVGIHRRQELLAERAVVEEEPPLFAVHKAGGHGFLGRRSGGLRIEPRERRRVLVANGAAQDGNRLEPRLGLGGDQLQPSERGQRSTRLRAPLPAALPSAVDEQSFDDRRRSFARGEEPLDPLVRDAPAGRPARHRADTFGLQPVEIDAPQRRDGPGRLKERCQDGMLDRIGAQSRDDLERSRVALASDALDQLERLGSRRLDVVEQEERRPAARRFAKLGERRSQLPQRGHHAPATEDRLGLEPAKHT